MIKNNLQF